MTADKEDVVADDDGATPGQTLRPHTDIVLAASKGDVAILGVGVAAFLMIAILAWRRRR